MLKRWRLPPDNYPDDTESEAFQQYQEGQVSPTPSQRFIRFLWQHTRLTLALVGIGIASLVALVWSLWPEHDIQTIILPNEAPTQANHTPLSIDTLVQEVGGDFPVSITDRQAIRIPARIEDQLMGGQARGYVFQAPSSITWRIALSSDRSWSPLIKLYGPSNNQLLNENGSQGTFTAEITTTLHEGGLYSISIESIDGFSGGYYTLTILPYP